MSDPAKSAAEIEDVLASIRRLVSDSGTPAAATSAAGQARDEAPGKLVLTPSLRVSDPDDPWARVPVPDEAEDAGPDIAPQSRPHAAPEPEGTDEAGEEPLTWGLEDRLSDWGEIEESADESVADAIAEGLVEEAFTPGRWQAEATEAPRDDAMAGDGSAGTDFDEPAPEAADFEPETGDTDWPDSGADSALRHLAIARGRAAPHGDDTGEEAAPEEEDGPGPAQHGVRAHPVAQDEGGEDEGEGHPQHPRPVPADEVESDEMTDDTGPGPAAADADAEAFTPIFSRRAAPAEAGEGPVSGQDAPGEHGSVHDDVEDLGEEPTPFTFPDSSEGILDEDTLREIVAEVVREELQGVLGQRITRNVRKMVRREIRIALAAEDLE